MAKTAQEIFNEKIDLIYEYNKRSPLFLRKAGSELENNNIEKTIEILNDGLVHYPYYAAAHLLLGKALALSGKYSLALRSFRKGCDILHSPSTFEFYQKEIENMKKNRIYFESSKGGFFFEEEDQKIEENKAEEADEDKNIEQSPLIKDPEVPDSSVNEKNPEELPIEERLEEIAKEISTARLSNQMLDQPSLSDEEEMPAIEMIVSETLAKIYIAQGELKEAINIYEKLLNRDPSKKEYYLQKIEEIRSQFEN